MASIKKGILELPTLGYILGTVLQGVAECLCNWYFLLLRFYLWEVAAGILEISMSKFCFCPLEQLLDCRSWVAQGTVLALHCVARRWAGWLTGCDTHTGLRAVLVTLGDWSTLCCGTGTALPVTWWAIKEKVFPGAYKRKSMLKRCCRQAWRRSRCGGEYLCNELCTDCVPVLPHGGGPRQAEDTAV